MYDTRIRGVEGAGSLQGARARQLPGDKAARIVEAMRISVAARGIAGATFDHVAREAGVSRGLLHYYFGTKERLLVEVVRRETDLRIERLEQVLAGASTRDEVLASLVASFEEFLGEGPTPQVMFYEMATLAQRNAEIAAELAELGRRTRGHLADALQARGTAGVLHLRADAYDIATFLFALADGLMIRRLVEPEFDIEPVIERAVAAARALLS
jgi:AcrR family transcriptional regulator